MRLAPLNLERSIVEAMGRVTLEFAALENWMMTLLRAALVDSLKDMDIADIFTAEMPFRTRVDVFGALCHHKIKNTSRLSELDALLKRITQVEESRNAIVHSQWHTKEPGVTIRSKVKAKRFEGLVTLEHALSLQEIRTTAKSIAKVREDLLKFALLVFIVESDSPEKKEEQSEAT